MRAPPLYWMPRPGPSSSGSKFLATVGTGDGVGLGLGLGLGEAGALFPFRLVFLAARSRLRAVALPLPLGGGDDGPLLLLSNRPLRGPNTSLRRGMMQLNRLQPPVPSGCCDTGVATVAPALLLETGMAMRVTTWLRTLAGLLAPLMKGRSSP